ncbi:MAG: periplasmic sensor signal transduction histidine kinase [Acidobacteriales bacterium]|nr:periplasmic sensor signal transduction histidine kinase [Terriglobales bacterium]
MFSISPKKFAISMAAFCCVYAAGPFLLQPGAALHNFGNIAQCLIQAAMVVTIGLNLTRRNGGNAFWVLMVLGTFLWLTAQFTWTYYETYLGIEVPNAYIGAVLIFLHAVPMIAAAATQPHVDVPEADRGLRLGYLDLALLLFWWIFLYAYIAGPWQFIFPDKKNFSFSFILLYTLENIMVAGSFLILWFRTTGSWKRIYGQFLGASTLYALASWFISLALTRGVYETGAVYDVPLIASMGWFAFAGYAASQTKLEPEAEQATLRAQTNGHSRLSTLALLSMPIFALWAAIDSSVAPGVQRYRVLITLVSMLWLMLLIFLKQDMLQRRLVGLLSESRQSLDEFHRLQGNLLQAEKLASLGRLVAGAAHEINNPLTAILGYSDLLADDASVDNDLRQIADKIRTQARRTKALVSSLLTFAKQSPMKRSLIDMNMVVASALQLRELDKANKDIKTVRDLEVELPQILGDQNHLLQMCFHIMNNAVEAMQEAHGRGTMTVSTKHEGGEVVFRCADTGPGVANPNNIFDPFYTTKAIGKGSGLGLSACYGIVNEHGGDIKCENQASGGALFTVSFPVAVGQRAEKAHASAKTTSA